MRVLFQASLQSQRGAEMAYVLQNMANVRNRLTQSPSATEDLRDKGHTNIPASGPRAPTWVQRRLTVPQQ